MNICFINASSEFIFISCPPTRRNISHPDIYIPESAIIHYYYLGIYIYMCVHIYIRRIVTIPYFAQCLFIHIASCFPKFRNNPFEILRYCACSALFTILPFPFASYHATWTTLSYRAISFVSRSPTTFTIILLLTYECLDSFQSQWNVEEY